MAAASSEEARLETIRAAFASGGEAAFVPPGATVPAAGLSEILATTQTTTAAARRMRISGALVTGVLDLEGSDIPASLQFENCTFEAAPNLVDARVLAFRCRGGTVPGLDAHGLSTAGDLQLSDGCEVHGTLTLSGARIGGTLDLHDAVLVGAGDLAMDAAHARIEGQMYAPRLRADGEINLIGTRVQGMASFWSATLRSRTGTCIQGERLEVGETFFLKGTFSTDGAIVLTNARIGGGLDMAGATVGRGPRRGRSIAAIRLRVGRNVSLTKGFGATGTLTFARAEIGGRLSFAGSELLDPDHAKINLAGLRAREVLLTSVTAPPEVVVDLRGATVQDLSDDGTVPPEAFHLAGFTYDRLRSSAADEATTIDTRLSWLSRNRDGYSAQIYDQLAATYRTSGDETAARRVYLAKERTRTATLGWAPWAWWKTVDVAVGYGYQYWRALFWLTLAGVLGGTYFHLYPPQVKGDSPPRFNAWAYAVDVLLPGIDLYQGDSFQPGPVSGQLVAWALILVGIVLTATVAASIARILKRP